MARHALVKTGKKPKMTVSEARSAIGQACRGGKSYRNIATLIVAVNNASAMELTDAIARKALRSMGVSLSGPVRLTR